MRLKWLFIALVFMGMLHSCSKTSLRSATYIYEPFDFSGVKATVKVEEVMLSDKSTIKITSDISGLTQGKIYTSHIHAGEMQQPGAILFNFDKINSTTGNSNSSVSMNITFDEYMLWDACYIIYNPDDPTRVVLRGNLGINHK